MLVLRLCEWLRDELSLAVITNDIYTREDAEFLVRNQALPADRVMGVETGARIAQALTIAREAIGWFDPLLDIASMRHETADERLFIS